MRDKIEYTHVLECDSLMGRNEELIQDKKKDESPKRHDH